LLKVVVRNPQDTSETAAVPAVLLTPPTPSLPVVAAREDILVTVDRPLDILLAILALAEVAAAVERQIVMALAAAAVLAFMDKGATALAARLAILTILVAAVAASHIHALQQIRQVVVAVGLVVAQVAPGPIPLILMATAYRCLVALEVFLVVVVAAALAIKAAEALFASCGLAVNVLSRLQKQDHFAFPLP
jgi:hypothetical protein